MPDFYTILAQLVKIVILELEKQSNLDIPAGFFAGMPNCFKNWTQEMTQLSMVHTF